MGRFEFVALPDEGKPDRPARAPAALQIEQTVIWAEARQISKMQSELAANGQELVVQGATGQVE